MTQRGDRTDTEVDALYGLPLEDFTSERNALARRLRERGERKEAQEVGKLPKPTRVAWIVNQLARTRPRELSAYLKAGTGLIEAHRAPLGHREAAGRLRKAAAAERAALEPLLDAARGLATKQGRFPGEAAIESVRETLQGALLDESARPLLEQGRLPVELAAPGLELGLAAPGSGRPARASRSRARSDTADAGRREELRRAQHAEKEARRLRDEAKRAVTARARERDRAKRQLDEARKMLQQRERELARAQERVVDARGAPRR
jgi:hypothetical protein